jgi:hypothetical protein
MQQWRWEREGGGGDAETSFLECVQIVSGQLCQYGGKEQQTEVCMAEWTNEALEPEEHSCYAEILSVITWLGNVLHHIIFKKHYRPVSNSSFLFS